MTANLNSSEDAVTRDSASIEKTTDELADDIDKSSLDVDLLSFHEVNAGRLIMDPKEAAIELGPLIAAKLKLTADGTKVLWPQPADDPNDPQNWSDGRKAIQLLIGTLAAIVPDFDSGIGIAALFPLSQQYNTTTGVINDMTSNWSIFLLGWGSIASVMLMRRFGRLPILFWSQVLALAFLIGCAVSPNLGTFTAMRCLTAFFGTCPQVTGLYIVTDIFPFHLQARKAPLHHVQLNIWTFGFVVSPFLSPFLFGFLVAKANWRWSYGIGCIYGGIVVLLIAFLGEETMYDRTVKPIPKRPTQGLRYRVETLLGITGLKMAKYRPSWWEVVCCPFNVIWRPHLLSILIFEALVFGFSCGLNTTNVVFFGSAPPFGFGYNQTVIAGFYATPIVGVLLGELTGRFLNDWIMNLSIRRNNGVFEAESRLWACYVAMPLYICGFVLLGAGLQHLNTAAVIIGWAIAQIAVMVNTVAVYAYCNDCFPKQQGEISALVNLARTLGGFSVAYFQVPWANKSGAIETLGVEGAVVVGLAILTVPVIQLTGRQLRVGGFHV
ncbi:major facilitator superfamily domain-containing protein [Hygrophoropsis aurantiaca]|uniref:Major facilitator superfamily domain-containing protein n=1 Tax=Hygrophoropsis aurantiaca TaxID=72124 RepID=A0ACB8A1B0_9AGAM|nr:major facilitator superfamily domain-containing protein [Hygrophoropsis aurantiaca]